ncbi:MAG: hypothetical protein HC857_02765 [Synechococcales cyanobacterium RU_4_20]|nr:hypothetical protein [Synechococcales cyanobacterium RU_4_20]NJR68459.1 hypothetical protein [Synechococcales cyanobacterium CRU_2_2]
MARRQFGMFVTAACDRAARMLNLTALLSLSLTLAGVQMTSAAQAPANVEAIKLAAVDAVPLLRPTGSQLPNGVYVFGESAQRHERGKAYMVFEVKDKAVTGAVYWPQSSFDCFEGRFHQEQLALRVTETYSRQIYTHAVAIAPDTSVLATNRLDATPVELGLEGMHRIATTVSRTLGPKSTALTRNETRILRSCQGDR